MNYPWNFILRNQLKKNNYFNLLTLDKIVQRN